ncbi:ATP-dependent helicase [Methylobacterium oryzihabitans]|uniref:DNA 3'-5' helicase n=1 Tax=Methylobacterium oryzihabitans TaxID=2499852 RepID=A0A437NVN2_9HYPH|nr:UvrD-helicase domain-containing protein [Methylobacterium oryzihabitans]RVU14080.1 ATP-dependent DNA helicase [Methylobacterium oryzihabitans]
MTRQPAGAEAPSPATSIAARARAAVAPQGASYLDGLNPEQRRAVEATEGPVLVLAGAGTGKTRVLTTRIAHLIATGRARPFDILSVTFTNKAAREMKERIGALIGPAGEGMPWLGTFHAIGTKILRRHAELVGLRPDFTILGTDDQLRLLKQVIAAADIDEKRWPARSLAHAIDGWKNRGLGPEQVPPGEAGAFAHGKGGALYATYQERLKTLNAVDFGDLLLLCLRLWRENPDVLAAYQTRFRYILVDEYQDTNVAQYLWLRLLAQWHRNVACVGDDDQSIYGWRGAEVDNILRFEHDFPGAVVVRLERNYRSTGHILAAASTLIARNEGRLGKTLRTEAVAGEKVTVSGAWDSEEEARTLCEAIEGFQAKGHDLSQIAVLVRISAQMREIEDRFVQLGLPYRVIGGPRFYERAEVRDALAYLRLTVNPADDLAFERIINTPKRGLGDATLQALHGLSRRAQVPLLQAARMVIETEELKPKPRSSLRALVAGFGRWAKLLENQPHSEVAQTVLEESGYTEMWQKERSADATGRLENLKELVRSMEEFPDLPGFLEHIALVMDANEGEGGARVSLMTLHAAKGLEFDTVFLPGWEDGLFPNQRALDESGRAGLEEERRLAHVGLTRARKRARISFAVNRRVHGLWSSTIPSRFIDELPEASVEVLEAPAHYTAGASRFDRQAVPFGSSYGTPGWQRAQANTAGQGPSREPFGRGGGRRGPQQIEGTLVAKSTGTASAYAAGMRIFHTKFGPGSVEAVDGNKLTVAFDKAGRKMVLDSFVEPA